MAEVIANIERTVCKGMGGIKHFLVAEWDETKSFDIVDGEAAVPVTGGYEAADFFKFVSTKETSNWVDAGTGTATTGSFSVLQTVSIMFDRYEYNKRAVLSAIACKRVIIIAIDNNGQGVLLGHRTGLDMATSAASSGTAPADKNGIDITFTHTSDILTPTIVQTEIDKLLN